MRDCTFFEKNAKQSTYYTLRKKKTNIMNTILANVTLQQ